MGMAGLGCCRRTMQEAQPGHGERIQSSEPNEPDEGILALLEQIDAATDGEMVRIKEEVADDRSDLCNYTILKGVSPERKRQVIEISKHNDSLDRAMGCMCGMAVGDALGHPFEFIRVSDTPGTSSFDLKTKEFSCEFNKFRLERGQWTDDAAMGLCMADSLIMRRGFDGSDMRIRFWCWWYRGYNNAFRNDTCRDTQKSIGLGGNVALSLESLCSSQPGSAVPPIYESATQDSGNGSLMRFAPLAIFFRKAALPDLYKFARSSSYTTHPGSKAAEACTLFAHLLVRALSLPAGSTDVRNFLDTATAEYYEVSGLSSKSGPDYDEMKWLVTSKPVNDTELSWNWKGESLEIERTLQARGWDYNGHSVSADYFGSYSLDGLAVALWCVYNTTSFDEAVTRAVNFCGDADSFGSMTGQLAGAFYGYSSINPEFVEWLVKWDDYDFAAHALLLHQLGTTIVGR